jgi:NAD(P)-dependent dehydrogenase (short-subunit alcohol dehydrogenase family)
MLRGTGMAASTAVVAEGRVAVVTGAASRIGLGLSERLVAEGMRVVMADVEAPALTAAADKLRANGAEILPVVTDVSKAASVDALRDRALETFGAVHLLCNNAGCCATTLVSEGRIARCGSSPKATGNGSSTSTCGA